MTAAWWEANESAREYNAHWGEPNYDADDGKPDMQHPDMSKAPHGKDALNRLLEEVRNA